MRSLPGSHEDAITPDVLLGLSCPSMATTPLGRPSEEQTSKESTPATAESTRATRGSRPDVGSDDPRRFTDSGIEVQLVYDDGDIADLDLEERLGEPGQYPFTRGIHPEMYRSRRWTMREYAGYATAQDDQRPLPVPARARLDRAVDGVRPAHAARPRLRRPALPRGGRRTGVAIDSIDDMRTTFDQIPLDKVSTSMTIRRAGRDPDAALRAGGEEQGVPSHVLRGTVQNDILKEYAARGTSSTRPWARCA